MENWKIGKLENWKIGKLENWKIGKLENWKIGKLEDSTSASDLMDNGKGPWKDFSLNLTCAGGDTGTSTRMFVVFSDAQNPANRSTTLSLSKDSVAKNVGIEIQRENERLVNFGPESGEVNQWMVGEFANEPVNIKLKARYISTSLVQEPTPGSANADATFVISYK
ncbi:fimbrial protein [Comamonas sp. Z1]|uniref:fimbrial protein n=1 Tax=Comamonas sp. Z1 TaxID=2601246 RepID=UPI00165317D5|nr:fimbrial protein [Comamonas sp. Z1]